MGLIRIVAIDDHPLLLEGVRAVLEGEVDLRLVAVSREAGQLFPLLRRHNPDLVLLDLQMPGFNPAETIRRATARFPKVRFVALTGSRDEALVRQVASAGVHGYLLKERIVKDVFPAKLRRIREGAILFDEEVAHALIPLHRLDLTPQEQDCLSLMVQGLTNAGIAEALGLSRKRVSNVLSATYAKLDIDGLNEHRWVTRVVAVREALHRGLIGVGELPRGEYR